MKSNKKLLGLIIIIIYFLVYVTVIINNWELSTIALKPIASMLAYYFIKHFVHMSEEQKKTQRTITLTFLLWVIADVFAAFGEITILRCNVDKNLIYGIEIILYAIVRIQLLIANFQLYYYLTRKVKRFRIIADIITIANCISAEIWLVFLKGSSESLVDGNILLLRQGDIYTIFSLTYLCISLVILGMLLLTWFYFQNMTMTLGQRLIILGAALGAFIDLAVALNNSYMDGNIVIDIGYKVSILLFAVGGLYYKDYPHQISFGKKDIDVEQTGTWKNAFYLLSYPVFIIVITGFRAEVLLYVLFIAFYIICCLYVKQITVVDNLLEIERKYNKQLKLYSNVIEQAPLSIVITDMDGNIEYVNPYFTEISGYSMEEAIGKNPRILKSEKTPLSSYEMLWNNLTNGKKWEGEFVNINKIGQEFEEKAVIVPIKNEKHETTNYVAIKENISEAKKIRNQLMNQNYFTSQLLDTIPSSIFYVSVNDIFLGANAECKKIYGVVNNDLIGMKVSNAPWMDEQRYQHFVQMKEESIHSHAPSIRQIKRRSASGEIASVLYSVTPFYLSDGQAGGFLGVMTDISELKQKEKELKVALKEANAATEAKSQFLANMSHEIRTPMNAIIGMSYLALKTNLDIKQRDYVNKIHLAANSLLGIINDILDFSKIESGKMELEEVEFDLDTVVTNSIGLLVQKAHEKQLEFLYHLPVGIPRSLSGDSLRLGQIITNLVSNAVKFTECGEIEIDVTEEDRRENQICLKFSVRDTGIGISTENKDKLFDAFTQSDSSTTRQFGGTGLGLSICKNLVELMGGNIWIESEYGKGSTFIFTAWFTIQKEEKLKEILIANHISGMKILIVDDNSAAREIMQEYLSAMGFQADAVSSGEDALYLIRNSDKNPYDAVFIDWQMPDMNGIHMIQNINNLELQGKTPSVILVTAYDMNEMVKMAKGLKVDAFLAKPVSQSTLYDTIVNITTSHGERESQSVSAEEDDYHLVGLNVLLVEDNVINQQIAGELLSGQGITFTTADNGNEAVLKISSLEEEYDLILMDLQMPVMDGFEATKKIRNLLPEIPIIAMTARTMLRERDKCYQVGMNDHVAKPIDPVLLFLTMKKWIKEERLSQLQSSRANNRDILFQTSSNDLAIDGINTKAGLKRVANNLELYKVLLKNFALNQQETVEQISEAIKNGKYDTVEKLSHMLRGVSGNIGATATQHICENIEKNAAMIKNEREMIGLNEQLKREMKIVISSIFEKITTNEQEEFVAELSGTIEEKLDKLCQLLEDGDSSAVDYFNSIKSVLKKHMNSDKRFDDVEMQINNYLFDAAKENLEKEAREDVE